MAARGDCSNDRDSNVVAWAGVKIASNKSNWQKAQLKKGGVRIRRSNGMHQPTNWQQATMTKVDNLW